MDIKEFLLMKSKERVTSLNLYFRLTELPPEIGSLKELKTLTIRGGELTTLPPEIGLLSHLEELNLNGNKITTLPPEIGLLKNLVNLNVANNRLTTLPPEIGLLDNLQRLDFSNEKDYNNKYTVNNMIATLPMEINNLKKIKNLSLVGNPINIPPEVIEKPENPKAILNYYFSLVSNRKRTLNEIKLLVVGQGSVGKTSIIQRMVYKRYMFSV